MEVMHEPSCGKLECIQAFSLGERPLLFPDFIPRVCGKLFALESGWLRLLLHGYVNISMMCWCQVFRDMLQGWLPGKGYGWGRRFIIISIILGICLAVSLGAPFDSAQVGQTL